MSDPEPNPHGRSPRRLGYCLGRLTRKAIRPVFRVVFYSIGITSSIIAMMRNKGQ